MQGNEQQLELKDPKDKKGKDKKKKGKKKNGCAIF